MTVVDELRHKTSNANTKGCSLSSLLFLVCFFKQIVHNECLNDSPLPTFIMATRKINNLKNNSF